MSTQTESSYHSVPGAVACAAGRTEEERLWGWCRNPALEDVRRRIEDAGCRDLTKLGVADWVED